MPLKLLISGGGTGGHIFPAIAIANEVKRLNPDAEILFVGAKGKMEMEKVPEAGYRIIGLNITGIQRNLSVANLAFPFRLFESLWRARAIIKDFGPDVVVGVGGFASGPVLRMATWMNIPTLIQEQNSFAGITNRWVAAAVNKVCVAYDGMEKFFPKERIVKTGNPVRKQMVDIEGKRQVAMDSFGLDSNKPVLLIIGGSLGARSINLALMDRLDVLLQKGIQVIWQTGKNFKPESEVLRAQYRNEHLVITEFIKEMDLAYAAADLIISRAGAIAVSELCIIGKPVVLVPFPHAAEDHQTKNALALVNTNAAIMVEDKNTRDHLIDIAIGLFDDVERRKSMATQIKKHGLPNASIDIAKLVIELAK